MMRLLKPMMSIVAATAVAGCMTVTRGAETIEGGAKRMTLVYASSQSAVLLEHKGNAFGESDAAAAEKIARMADGALSGLELTFTASKSEAARPDYRFVFAFDPAPSIAEADLCASGAVETAPGNTKTRLVTVFCRDDGLLASAIATNERISGLDDPVAAKLVRASIVETIMGRASINQRAQ